MYLLCPYSYPLSGKCSASLFSFDVSEQFDEVQGTNLKAKELFRPQLTPDRHPVYAKLVSDDRWYCLNTVSDTAYQLPCFNV